VSGTEQTPNPFAPTPIGKGWTPPEERRAGGSGLADLFDDTHVESADNAHETVTGDDPQNPPADESGESLADLFDDTPSRGPRGEAPVGNPAAARTDTGPVARRRVRRKGVPAALRATRHLVSDGDDDDDAGDDTAAGVGNVEQTQPAAVIEGRRDERRDAETAAAHPGDGDEPPVAQTRARQTQPVPAQRETRKAARGDGFFERSDADIERAWNVVDQTIALVQSDIQLQRAVTGIPLTSDAGTFRRECDEVHQSLRRKMASLGIAPAGLGNVETVLDLVVDEISGISVLGDLFRDPSVDEILVDRWDVVSVERGGKLERTPVRFRSPQHAEGCARALALKVSDRAVSRAIPLVTAELPAARVTFAFGAVVKGGLVITIRKFRPLLGLDDLLRYGSLDEDMVAFLRDAVRARAGILVSGGTGTGKTTIINLLSSFIPDSERVISIEDAFELKLANTHVVSLQTKEASSLDDTISVGLAELLRNTLRMRPDRIIVGEIREGAGAMVMLAAASTGHDGTLTTVHANSAEGAVNERLPDLVRQGRGGLETDTILRSIVNAFDLVIHVGRTRHGNRYIAQIAALDGVDAAGGRIRLTPLFTGTETPDGVRFERHQVSSETGIGRRLARRRES